MQCEGAIQSNSCHSIRLFLQPSDDPKNEPAVVSYVYDLNLFLLKKIATSLFATAAAGSQ
jgi:hypothetical protein